MKIVCDCGNFEEFEIDKTVKDVDKDFNVSQDYTKFDINGEHDEVWIQCSKCNTAIHFFT
jgi:Fe2+ or Zn2+ uptake regulation protein